MSLRTFDEVEREALAQRARKTWSTLRQNDFPVEVQLPSLIPGFGDWRRVTAPVPEPQHRLVCVLFRSAATNEYALLSLPQDSDHEAVCEADMGVLLDAARDAVVGDFLEVWRWTLDATPPLGQASMLFARRLPDMSEEVRFLAAFTLLGDAYRAAAGPKRVGLRPMPLHTRVQVDRLLWEATEGARQRVVEWAGQEAARFVDTIPDSVLAEDDGNLRLEVDHLVETFVDEQARFDPLGERRVNFDWGVCRA